MNKNKNTSGKCIPIRVLLVEDSDDDAALVVRELRQGGYDPDYRRIDTPGAMEEALNNEKWDVIICDYVLPLFGMPEALEMYKKSGLDYPFILVSGTVGEDIAVGALKAGVHDYIMKDRMARLASAVKRELREAEKRRLIRQAENAIQTLVKSTVGTTGENFFNDVVKNMCEWLGTDCTFIGQIVDGNNVKALSMQLDGEKEFDNSYKLNGTPCGSAVENGYSFYPEGVCKLFPDSTVLAEMGAEGYVGTPLRDKNGKPIGILCSISRHKLDLPQRTSDVMEIIAAKASSEIERMHAEERIKASLKEKEVLLKEIHHRVKNNLQVISSLLNLQSKSIQDEDVLSILRESQNRVKSMALVHEKLYQSKDLSQINFEAYARSLVKFLFRSYGISTNDINVVIDVCDIVLDVNMSIPCGLIINELVSNSLKHAFPADTKENEDTHSGNLNKGEIKISLHIDKDARIGEKDIKSQIKNEKANAELIISDNGVGIPEDFDIRNTESLGLQLVDTLTSQIDGSLECSRNGGTEFKIRFKV